MIASRMLVMVAAAVALTACATSIPEQRPGAQTPETSEPGGGPGGGVPGRPEKTDAGRTAGAPFRIPALVQSEGGAIVLVRAKAEADIAAACGGCVTVLIAEGTDTRNSVCQYSGHFRGGESDSTSTAEAPFGSLVLTPGVPLTLFTGTLPAQQFPCDEEGYLPKAVPDTETPTETATPTETDAPTETGTPTETGAPSPTE